MTNPPHTLSPAKLTFSIKEAASALGVGINNTYHLVHHGRLKSVRVGRRLILPKRELEDFLAEAEQGD